MRLVVTGCTHREHYDMKLPAGDVFIHTGDLDVHTLEDFIELDRWFDSLDFQYKIFVGGNHDKFFYDFGGHLSMRTAIYLEDSYCIIDGIKFFGSPWTPIFNNWYFMADIKQLKARAKFIPSDTNVLITHGPCYGILDKRTDIENGMPLGDVPLLERVKEIKPKLHLFSHIHSGYGSYTDGKTDFYNVSYLDEQYAPAHEPVIIDI